MNQRALCIPVSVSVFLLSALSCSKKDDPTTIPATSTGSYTLDGRAISAKATAVVNTLRTTTAQNSDMLDIQLVTTPQPQSGPETLDLVFQKLTSQPNSAYQLNASYLLNGGHTQSTVYANNVTTLSTISSGSFSGTFSATATGSTIQSGVFMEVHP